VVTVARDDHPLQFVPSIDVANWMMYDLILLVPATVPFHVNDTGVSKYDAGDAVNIVGGVGRVLRRTAFETAHAE
jgi:hypothetical protein